MRPCDPKGPALAKSFEALRLQAYPDPGTGDNPWTIGWGHTGAEVHRGLTWTEQEAEDAFLADWREHQLGVEALTTFTTPRQLAALTCLTFNIGVHAFQGSTLRKFHNLGKFLLAAGEFQRWNRSGGRSMPGLTRRRLAEAALYASG